MHYPIGLIYSHPLKKRKEPLARAKDRTRTCVIFRFNPFLSIYDIYCLDHCTNVGRRGYSSARVYTKSARLLWLDIKLELTEAYNLDTQVRDVMQIIAHAREKFGLTEFTAWNGTEPISLTEKLKELSLR